MASLDTLAYCGKIKAMRNPRVFICQNKPAYQTRGVLIKQQWQTGGLVYFKRNA